MVDKYTINPKEVKIGQQISQGGQGVIYEGYYNEKKVVIKLFVKNSYNEREIQAYTKLTHEFMVKFHGYFIDNEKNINLVLDYAEGEDVSELILLKKLNYMQKLLIMEKLAIFLIYLREQHVIHRDLKPQNIKVKIINDKNIELKVLDFGISKISTLSIDYTRQNIGSLAYAPPEIFSMQDDDQVQVSYKFDIWSLGMICCYIFSEISPPWKSNNSNTKNSYLLLYIERKLVLKEAFIVPDSLDSNIKTIVSLCTKVYPDERITPATLLMLIGKTIKEEKISEIKLSEENFK